MKPSGYSGELSLNDSLEAPGYSLLEGFQGVALERLRVTQLSPLDILLIQTSIEEYKRRYPHRETPSAELPWLGGLAAVATVSIGASEVRGEDGVATPDL